MVLGVLKEDLGDFFKPKEALKMVFGVILLGCFHNFSLDPYYEPLLWFMMRVIRILIWPNRIATYTYIRITGLAT